MKDFVIHFCETFWGMFGDIILGAIGLAATTGVVVLLLLFPIQVITMIVLSALVFAAFVAWVRWPEYQREKVRLEQFRHESDEYFARIRAIEEAHAKGNEQMF